MKNIMKIVKNNAKLYIALGIIIVLGTIGIAFAVNVGTFNPIAIDATTIPIDATITYDEKENGSEIINNGNMLPIDDNLVNGPDVSDKRVLKATFNVTGNKNNPEGTIYDIALHDIDIDCELRTSDVNWRLYKNGEFLSEGTLSPTFDTMNNNRLVLTESQEDLTLNTDKYTFLLWISESCPGDIAGCDPALEQSKYLNKHFSASIKIELTTKAKKPLVRITGNENSCEWIAIDIPNCNQLTYNGNNQALINENANYNLLNNIGKNAGIYVVTARLNNGYKWRDGSTDAKKVSCDINKKSLSITTLSQNIMYGQKISNTIDDVSVNGLITGDNIEFPNLTSSIVEVGTGKISSGGIKIQDVDGNDITSNYAISYNNTGDVVIRCQNTATLPNISDHSYTGNEFVGVTGGFHVDIAGSVRGTKEGIYKVQVTPKKNYCWNDGDTSTKELTWNITPNDNDTVPPKVNLTSESKLKSSSQDVILSCTDNVDVAEYYFGNKAPTLQTQYSPALSTNTFLKNESVNQAGTYYLSCKDSAGNVSDPVNIVLYSYTVYNMLFNGVGTINSFTTSNYDQVESPSVYIAPYGTNLTYSSLYTAPSNSTFKGWSTSAPSSSLASVTTSSKTLTSNSTYTMWFNRTSYTISYNLNGGINGPSTQTKYYGVNSKLSNTVPTKGTDEFLGWGASSTSTEPIYHPGDDYAENNSRTLYAIWRDNS